MGKESIPAQFLYAVSFPKEEFGLENLPQEPTIHEKYSKMSANVLNYSPMLARREPCHWLHDQPCPSWDPQLNKSCK